MFRVENGRHLFPFTRWELANYMASQPRRT